MALPPPKLTSSADGTPIAFYELGRGPLTWLVAPAMGAPAIAMERVFDSLADTHRIVTYDMRGFHRSGAPSDPRRYAIADHVDDLAAVARAARLDRFMLGGWSMGVPVSLEYAARARGDVLGLVLINGPYEAALEHALPVPGAARLLTGAIERVGGPVGKLMNPISRRVLGRRGMGRLLQRIGLLARDPEFFEQVLDEFRHIDWPRYLQVMLRLHEHSAAAHLERIDVPTLLTAGTNDRMTPVSTARHMHRRIRGSELFVVEGGTHYMPAEFPTELGQRIRRFALERLTSDPDLSGAPRS
jgi:pimeloyl-ACP methyl ester carboxylesterase